MKNQFKNFGIMLDCSRNAVMKIDTIKNYLLILKKMGYNCLFLYTEDTYTVANEPYFGYMRGRYSEEELSELVSFGNRVDIEIIPCVQTLAHLNGTIRWGKIPTDCNDILLVGDERTYEMIENMFISLKKSFTTNKIHIGMDEAMMLGRGEYLNINGYEDIASIMKRHLDRVIEIAKKYFDELLIWSDMYVRAFNENNYYLNEKTTVPEEIKKSLPKEAIPVYWDYYHFEEELYDVNFDAHCQLSANTWFAGGIWTWGGFMPQNRFSVPAMRAGIKSAAKNKIKSAFMTLWGDDGGECSLLSALPGLYAVSEFAKGNFDMELIKKGFKKHTGIEYDDFMLLDEANYVDREVPNPKLYIPPNPAKYMFYSDPFCGFLDSTVIGGEGEKYEALSSKLSQIAKQSRKYGYLFKTASKLCDVLAIKFELGVKTREIYKSGNLDALRTLAYKDYCELEKRIKEFHKAYREQWMRENHPSGFDVQDIRIGGLLQRVTSCKIRLRDMADGKISKIDELEVEILPYTNGRNCTVKEPTYVNNYKLNATPNVF